jgi:TolB protein
MRSGRFSIGVMRPDGSGERTLADGYQVSGPTWAPNGRVLMFYREDPVESEVRGGRARLFTVDLSGRNEREVVTPLDASDPAWSPLQP